MQTTRTVNRPKIIMRRLGYRLPDFVRVTWVSDNARDTWNPRISQIAKVWWAVEEASVLEGIRPCGLITIVGDEFVRRAAGWARRGYCGVPLDTRTLTRSVPITTTGLDGGNPRSFSTQCFSRDRRT